MTILLSLKLKDPFRPRRLFAFKGLITKGKIIGNYFDGSTQQPFQAKLEKKEKF